MRWFLNALNKLPLREQPNDNGTGDSPPSSETPPTGNDTASAADGNDTAAAASGDLLDEGKPAAPKGDLLDEGESDSAASFGEAVDAETFKTNFPDVEDWDDDRLNGFLDIVNKAEDRGSLAKSLMDFYAETSEAMATDLSEQFQATIQTWQQEVMDHKDLGGANLQQTMSTVRNFINTYSSAPAEAMEMFRHTGISNNIHFVQLLKAAADATPGEARPVEGAPASPGKSMADRIFGGPSTN